MLNRIPPRLRAAAMTATLAFAAAFVAPFASAQGAGYWHTSGNKILDSNGAEVRMAGVNWYGFETPDFLIHGLWAQDYHTVLNTIKSLGFNVIRIPFSNQMVESNPVPTNFTQFANGGTVNQALVGATALQDLDTIVSTAGSIGLRVILDNHRSEAGSSNESSGLWYTSAYPQANWIADWQTLATRYSASKFTFNGNPTVIGMDLRNEPHLSGSSSTSGSCWTGDTATNGCPTSLTAQNWPVAATAAGNAILAINPKLLIFVEGNDCYSGVCGWQGGNLIGVATNPITLSVPNQLVYSAHDYGPNLFQQPWFNSSTTTASLDAIWNKYWGYISANGTAPVWLGEFGTDNSSADIESNTAGSQGQWFSTLVAFLQNNPQINWTNWALNGEDTYALLDSNYDATPVSAQKESLLQSIQFPLGGGTTPGFTLSPSPASLSVTQGSSATDTITVTDIGGFTGTPTLTASSSNSGVITTVNGDTITVAASSTATGTATITVTGTSGSGSTAITANTTIAVTIVPKSTPGFTLTPSSSSLSVTQGSSATDTIAVTDTGGFTGTPTLTASSSNSGVTAAVSGDTITVTASTTATGTATITVTGTSGSGSTAITANTTIAVTVVPKSTPGFTLTASPAALSVAQGGTAADTITVTDTGGFTGTPTLTASSSNIGVTATVNGDAITVAASSTATGSATITVTGTSGSGSTAITATTSFTVTVTTSGNFCHIVYTINSQWPGSPGGFGAGLTIENTSTTNWTSWTLTWSFANGQTVTQLWNGSETQSGANVTVNNLSYDGSIPAGGSLNSVGFNGTWNGTTNSVPTAFTVNGHACN
jgi:endoglucanase